MTGTQCGSCGGRVKDGYLCRRCSREIREKLADLAPGRQLLPVHAEGAAGRGTSTRWDLPSAVLVGGLADQLETTAARLARIGARGKRGKGDLGPTPFHERATEVRGELVRVLAPWASRILELERPTPQPPACLHRSLVGADCRRCAVDVPQLHAMRRARWSRTQAAVRDGDVGATATYLLARMNVIEGQEDAPKLHVALLAVVRRVERVIDRSGERLAVGECGAELPAEAVCQRQLYADPAEAFVVCPACGTRWSVAERRAWLLSSANDSLGTATTISTALTRLEQPVTADRIYQWKKRGRLLQHGTDQRGAPLYRLGDVVDLLTADMRKAEERRVKAAKMGVARVRTAS